MPSASRRALLQALINLSPQAPSDFKSIFLSDKIKSAIKRSAVMEKVDTYQPIGRNDRTVQVYEHSTLTFRQTGGPTLSAISSPSKTTNNCMIMHSH
jgi:hypothetical protein